MAEINAELVKKLRDATNVSMMECKRALVETSGDIEKATRVLRERGIAVAAKKSARAANQGLIASATSADGKSVSLVEVNCETDFVARNAQFQSFVADLAQRATATDEALAGQMRDAVVAKIAEIGENVVIARNTRFVAQGPGRLQAYIHLGGKVGVLVELACVKPETAANPIFIDLARDLSLHVAACAPRYLTAADIPAAEVTAEREIYAKQVQGKPPQIVEKIVDGKIRKFHADVCFVNQPFVKEPKQSIADLLAEIGKQVGDTPAIRRFVRYQLGQ
jgi:elongation factor Ts